MSERRIVLLKNPPDSLAAMNDLKAIMEMQKIDIRAIEAALRGN